MFLASGFFGSLFIRSFAHYAGDVSGSYFETPSFRYQMNRFITEMYFSAQFSGVNTVEDFEQTTEGKRINRIYDEELLAVTQAYNLLESSGIEVHRDAQNRYRYYLNYNNVGYYFYYNGELISEEDFHTLDYVEWDEVPQVTEETHTEQFTRVAVNTYNPHESGSVPQYINDISAALRLLGGIDDYTCFGEVEKEEVVGIIEAERRVALESECYSRNTSNHYIDSVENINYAIIYNSGVCVTNCGITATDTEAQILEKLVGDGRFAEGYANGKYTLYEGSATQESKSVFGLLRSWMFGDYYTESQLETQNFVSGYNDDVVAAYVGVPVYDGVDGISISEQAYNDFRNTHLSSPALLLTLTVITFLLACAAAVYLISVAGKTADGVKINFTDKVPAEINWVLGLAAMALLTVVAFFLVVGEFNPSGLAHDYYYEGVTFILAWMKALAKLTSELIAVCFAGFFMIWTALNMSLARNIRSKTFVKHTLCYFIIILAWKLVKFLLKPFGRLFKFLGKKSKKTAEKIGYIFACDYSKGQGTKFKLIAFVSAIMFVVVTVIYYMVIGAMAYSYEFEAFVLAFFGILGDLAILGFILLIIVSADRIFEAVNDVKNGNLNRTIDTRFMPPFMKRFAEDILSMQDGLQNAVESAVRDQRMKAELITNVSHDLKTPLTSIVTYVDLLKKCDIEGEDANRYVNILDEKAQKMKKLIEDLVEASKASSGAMEIHPVRINLCEFAAQAVGEHEDELKNKNIEILLRMPEYPVTAMADSQKTSRVVENLFSNIRKYAMNGTRAYVEVSEGTNECSITFKNISAEALGVSADELTQRFVRGDASRSSEGNGLGLSIAKNLCELQKGKLEIKIDGDLFKVTVILPKA